MMKLGLTMTISSIISRLVFIGSRNNLVICQKLPSQLTHLVTLNLMLQYCLTLALKDLWLRDLMNTFWLKTKHNSYGRLSLRTTSLMEQFQQLFAGQFMDIRTSSWEHKGLTSARKRWHTLKTWREKMYSWKIYSIALIF